jgi:hypothetical protein
MAGTQSLKEFVSLNAMATNSRFPFDFERISLAIFRRWVWILSGSKYSLYVFEKKYETVLLKMYSEGLANDKPISV